MAPYSQNLNPMEVAFSKIENILGKAEFRTREVLVEAMSAVLSAVTTWDARNFFEDCGYGLLVQAL